uniref:Uncharacterized protein n=1 Tax=Knipowitschia caucasica TaxID=637954 RepID=A0AAV2LQ14_KNICA
MSSETPALRTYANEPCAWLPVLLGRVDMAGGWCRRSRGTVGSSARPGHPQPQQLATVIGSPHKGPVQVPYPQTLELWRTPAEDTPGLSLLFSPG